MNHGRQATLVTGGYITSDSESLSDKVKEDSRQHRPSSSRAPTHFFRTRSAQEASQEKRRRAQSLIVPVSDDHSPSGEGSGSGRSFASGRAGNLRPNDISIPADSAGVERRRSQSTSIIRLPSASRTPQNGHNGIPPRSPLASTPGSRMPSTHFAEPPASTSRHSSQRISRDSYHRDVSRSPPKRSDDLPARSREVDRLRREEGVSSPEGSRKGKEKAQDPPPRRHGLASSLLNAPLSESTSLTPEQFRQLRAESDIGKALHTSPGPKRRLSHAPGGHERRATSSTMDAATNELRQRELYTVTAPPPLLHDDEAHHRDRTLSVSSSIAPSPDKRSERQKQASWDEADQDTEPARRRREARRRSSTLVEPEGGHVPFTHHLPTRVAEVQESSDDDTNTQRTLDNYRPAESVPPETIAISQIAGAESKTTEKKRKGRISGLFRRSKKGTDDSPISTPPLPVHPSHHEQAKLDNAKAREKYDKELVIRKLEQERRDTELLDERKYRAFVEVSAHPSAITRANQAGAHIWATYSQIYESIEDPPKQNPLAVLRYMEKSRKQDEARTRYKLEQAERDKDPTSFPSVWSNPVYHASPDVVAASSNSKSINGRSDSRATNPSSKAARSSTSVARTVPHLGGDGWHYTVDDVSRYRDAGGEVNYFMPPLHAEPQTIKSVESLTAAQTARQQIVDDFHPTQDTTEIDLGSSLGSNGRSGGAQNGNLRSASMLSVNGTAAGSPGSSRTNLARTSSVETGRASKSPTVSRGVNRRGHQSMSSMSSIQHGMKGMALGFMGKKQRTLPHPGSSTPLGMDSGPDEPNQDKPMSSHNGITPKVHITPTTPSRYRANHPTRASTLATPVVPEAVPEHDSSHHRRLMDRFEKPKLVVKNNLLPSRMRRGSPSKESLKSPVIAEHEYLTAVVAEECDFVDRQVGDGRVTQRQRDAEERLAQYEDQIYQERHLTVTQTRERMAPLVASARYADDYVRLQLSHLDQLRTYSTVSAEVNLDFPGIDEIRERYTIRPQRRSDESASPWDKSQPPSRRGSRKASTSGGTIMLSSSYTMGTKPWSRRAALDQHGARVDPLTQVDLALREAGVKETEMRQSRIKARVKLQDMSQEIADLEIMKNRIRNELETQTANLKVMRDRLDYSDQVYRAPSSWRPSMSHRTDAVLDVVVRHYFGPAYRLTRWIFSPMLAPTMWLWDRGVMGRLTLLAVVFGFIGVFFA